MALWALLNCENLCWIWPRMGPRPSSPVGRFMWLTELSKISHIPAALSHKKSCNLLQDLESFTRRQPAVRWVQFTVTIYDFIEVLLFFLALAGCLMAISHSLKACEVPPLVGHQSGKSIVLAADISARLDKSWPRLGTRFELVVANYSIYRRTMMGTICQVGGLC